MATVTTRLDSHDRRIARTEKYQAGENPEGPEPVWTDHESRRDGGGGGGGWFGGGRDDGFARGRGGPREPKLSFPRYDGETDPLPWLNKCDGFFRGYRTLEEDKVWMASLHLDGVAAQWFFQLEHDLGIISWPRFAEYANLRFGPPIRSNALGEIKELQRTGSVEDY